MSKEITIAIISGIVGILGGIIAWIQAVRISRLKGEMDIALEQAKAEFTLRMETMKANNERRRKAFEVAAEEVRPIQEALDKGWQVLQEIKDGISILVSSARYDQDKTLDKLRMSTTKFIEGYSKHGPNLPEPARLAWHSAKKTVVITELFIDACKTDITNSTALPAESVQMLRGFHTSFTEYQLVLMASRQKLRDSSIEKILELL